MSGPPPMSMAPPPMGPPVCVRALWLDYFFLEYAGNVHSVGFSGLSWPRHLIRSVLSLFSVS